MFPDVLLVGRRSAAKHTDAPTSTAPATTVVEATVSSTGNTVVTPTAGVCACACFAQHPSDSSSRTAPNQVSECLRSSTSVERDMDGDTHDTRTMLRELRRLDRELAARGITNPLLVGFVRFTKTWSPASSKASFSRHSRRKRNTAARTERVVTQSSPSLEPRIESETDWSEEATMCDL